LRIPAFPLPRPAPPAISTLSLHDALPISQVEPIFLQKRAGHLRCYVCHAERSNNSFRLEKRPPGASFWSEEQSRRNFTMLSRLVDRKSTRLNSSHRTISYAVFCLKKKKKQ